MNPDPLDGNRAESESPVQAGPLKIVLRSYREPDFDDLIRLTLEGFAGVTLEQNVEDALGILNGHDWRWRKARHLEEDVAANPGGILVAESGGRVIGYVTTREDREAGKGRIPNLAVAAEFRKQGVARCLIEKALERFRAAGLEFAVIETMAQNEAGHHAYLSCGFVEVARQIHFARRL